MLFYDTYEISSSVIEVTYFLSGLVDRSFFVMIWFGILDFLYCLKIFYFYELKLFFFKRVRFSWFISGLLNFFMLYFKFKAIFYLSIVFKGNNSGKSISLLIFNPYAQ